MLPILPSWECVYMACCKGFIIRQICPGDLAEQSETTLHPCSHCCNHEDSMHSPMLRTHSSPGQMQNRNSLAKGRPKVKPEFMAFMLVPLCCPAAVPFLSFNIASWSFCQSTASFSAHKHVHCYSLQSFVACLGWWRGCCRSVCMSHSRSSPAEWHLVHINMTEAR